MKFYIYSIDSYRSGYIMKVLFFLRISPTSGDIATQTSESRNFIIILRNIVIINHLAECTAAALVFLLIVTDTKKSFLIKTENSNTYLILMALKLVQYVIHRSCNMTKYVKITLFANWSENFSKLDVIEQFGKCISI